MQASAPGIQKNNPRGKGGHRYEAGVSKTAYSERCLPIGCPGFLSGLRNGGSGYHGFCYNQHAENKAAQGRKAGL